MSPQEVVSRVGDRVRGAWWSRRRVRPGEAFPPAPRLLTSRTFLSPIAPEVRSRVPEEAARRLVEAADRLLDGQWEVLGTPRPDIVEPDWFLDPVTGRRAPDTAPALGIDHRDETVTGNVKSVWELSRHHHLTVLAAAWWLTGESRYADLVARQLRSWWADNPFLSGIHWTSGIELGVRLTSWVWVRRLLADWPGVHELFEENPAALAQVRWHQEHLAAFRSRGSSANNHAVAEATGLLAAACAFPWFADSEAWRRDAARRLEHELRANTFPSGLNRELATDYHRFVTELGLVALVEAGAVGHPLGEATRTLLARSLDAAAAALDAGGHPPRQGDGDEGRALVLDEPAADPWAVLLACGAGTVGPRDWWPARTPGVMSTVLGGLWSGEVVTERPSVAPRAFPDAGVYLLRSSGDEGPELWCRCDGGPHGFLSIAAHGHADALSVEVRHGGVELLTDPGTYCYHGEPQWRSYFRSTRAHNTLEVDGVDQAVEAGPFMWATHADAVVDRADLGGRVQTWSAHHTGYTRLDAALRHERRVVLDADDGRLTVVDTVRGSRPHTARLSWHLGPEVGAVLTEHAAELSWHDGHGDHRARLELPPELTWSAHRGETNPPLGWYSPRFGARVPATTLVGVGGWAGILTLRSELSLPEGAATAAAPAGVTALRRDHRQGGP